MDQTNQVQFHTSTLTISVYNSKMLDTKSFQKLIILSTLVSTAQDKRWFFYAILSSDRKPVKC